MFRDRQQLFIRSAGFPRAEWEEHRGQGIYAQPSEASVHYVHVGMQVLGVISPSRLWAPCGRGRVGSGPSQDAHRPGQSN